MPYTKVVINDPLYLQPDSYSAQDDRRILADLMSAGVVGTNHFLVTFSSGLTVTVAAGTAYIPGLMVADQGLYRLYESGSHNIAVAAGDGSNPRIDQVILRVLDAVHDTSGLYETRVEVVPGTPTSGATLANRSGAADLTTLTENSKNVLLLADVLVPTGAASIDSTKIGDKRTYALVGQGNMGGGSSAYYDSTLAVDTANFDITTIPAGAVLDVYLYLRTTEAVVTSSAFVQFDGAATATYDRERLKAAAATVTGAEAFAGTSAMIADVPGANASANKFAAVHLTIPHFASVTNFKTGTVRAAHVEGTGSGTLYAESFAIHWRSTSLINRVTVIPGSGNFKADSRCTVFVK